MEKHKDAHDRLVIAMLALIILCLIYIGIQLTPMHERHERMDRRVYQPQMMHTQTQIMQNPNGMDYQPQ